MSQKIIISSLFLTTFSESWKVCNMQLFNVLCFYSFISSVSLVASRTAGENPLNAQTSAVFTFISSVFVLSSSADVSHTDQFLQSQQLPAHLVLSLSQSGDQPENIIQHDVSEHLFKQKTQCKGFDLTKKKQSQSLQWLISIKAQILITYAGWFSTTEEETWHNVTGASETNVELFSLWPSRDASHFLASLFDTNEG